MKDYYNQNYSMTVQEANDKLTVSKSSGSNWCGIAITTNRNSNGMIMLRSKAMAEQLHFMLGQMLGK